MKLYCLVTEHMCSNTRESAQQVQICKH